MALSRGIRSNHHLEGEEGAYPHPHAPTSNLAVGIGADEAVRMFIHLTGAYRATITVCVQPPLFVSGLARTARHGHSLSILRGLLSRCG